ncbi:serine/threonine kinase-like domain-containing protein STKLD1 [Hypomesus transpacificus]|uniref:serine/threonine kinase-like domain-containing protein STKLD1 n=1 Tax=Hypomesus transpacificus TaxID=137520 RepID=UPI001F081C12|nr:serine/threonine kinase-like domain-containing protein STKLD1 [Hypomesus transpacificus]
MTYALAYLHKDNIAHRSIKPSNIQLSGQSTFVLFDFEPATITRDRARVKQRVKKNLKRWLAPECLSLNQWTEMSDIWSLGCVVLDMVTCHLLDMDSSVTQLLRLHQDQTPLKVIVHSGLNQVLTNMFRCHPNKRANIWELVEESLVKSCLVHCGISIRTIERMVPSGVHEPPLHQGLDNSLEFMERYGRVESVQLSVLAFLLSDQNNMLYRVSDVVQAVTMAMHRHQCCAAVQLEACQVLQRRIAALLAESGDISSLCSRTLVREIRRTIQNFPRHTQLLARAFLLLSCLAPHDQAVVELMVSPKGMKEVVRTITTFPGERDVITSCCKYLRSLTGLGVRVDGVALTGAVEGLCAASDTHAQDSEVMECVCSALCFITLQGVSDEKDVEESVLLLMHTLIRHNTHTTMVKLILQALTNLLNTSELAAFRLLLAPDGGRGLGLIKEVKLHHHDNPEVIGGVCGLLRAMAQYDSVVSEMVSDQTPEELEEIVLQFEANEEMVLLARQALGKLKNSQ